MAGGGCAQRLVSVLMAASMSGRRIEMEGRVFGRLVVVDLQGINQHGERMYSCLCECGGYVVTQGSTLRRGLCSSCGCKRAEGGANFTALREQRAAVFAARAARQWGRLTPLSQTFEAGVEFWRCVCACGAEHTARAGDVLSGRARSCGCLRREVSAELGASREIARRTKPHPLGRSFV